MSLAPLLLVSGLAGAAEPAAVAVALRWVDRAAASGAREDLATAEEALLLAGTPALPPLLRRLATAAPRGGGAVVAWAVGRAARPDPLAAPPPAAAAAELVRALSSPSRATRLAAASSLGELGATRAEPDLLRLMVEDGAEEDARRVILLALAGTAGTEGRAAVNAELTSGGGPEWSSFGLALAIRVGRTDWRARVNAAALATDPSVRALAATSLVLLAEPAAACPLAEIYGRESEPMIRRLLLHAVAASSHPTAPGTLRQIARHEADPVLATVAADLATELEAPWRHPAPSGVQGRGAAAALQLIVRGLHLPHHLDDLDVAADPSHLDLLDVALRELPLRRDARWPADHARVAALRARLACADGIDCTPGRR